MKKIMFGLILMCFALLFMSVPKVEAAGEFTIEKTNSSDYPIASGTFSFNITMLNGSGLPILVAANAAGTDNLNVTLWATCTDCNDTTITQFCFNDTYDATDTGIVGCVIDTAALLEDSSTYTITANVSNKTAGALTSATTTFTISVDNTVPAASTTSQTSILSHSETFTAAVTGARTTSCNLTVGSSSIFTMTHSGDTCTYQFNEGDILDGHNEQFTVLQSDGINTTSTSFNLDVQKNEVDSTDAEIAGMLAGRKGMDFKTLAIIGVIAYFVFRKKKKK